MTGSNNIPGLMLLLFAAVSADAMPTDSNIPQEISASWDRSAAPVPGLEAADSRPDYRRELAAVAPEDSK